MRNRLAHKYWLLDAGIVWAVVENDLPKRAAWRCTAPWRGACSTF